MGFVCVKTEISSYHYPEWAGGGEVSLAQGWAMRGYLTQGRLPVKEHSPVSSLSSRLIVNLGWTAGQLGLGKHVGEILYCPPPGLPQSPVTHVSQLQSA